MRKATALAMAGLLLLACAGALSDAADAAEALPDLHLAPGDIAFYLYDEKVEGCYRGQLVVIEVTVHNAGPGNSSAARLSIYDGESLLTELLVGQPVLGAGPYNYSVGEYVWNTSASTEGEHDIRVEASDPAGDANLADNAASATFTLVPPPELSLNLVQVSEWAATNGPIEVQLHGQMRVDRCGNLTVQVSLSSRMDRDWHAIIDHTDLTFAGPGTRMFNVTARSPSTNPTHRPRLTVEAMASGEGYRASASASINLSVTPYIRLRLECNEPYKEIPLGGSVSYTINVINEGRSTDSFNIGIGNREDLERRGWNLTLNRTRVDDLPPNGRANVTLTARAPEEWTLWKSEPVVIELNGSSTTNGSIRQTYPIFAYLKGGNPVLAGSLLVLLLSVVASLVAASWVLAKRARKRKQADAVEAPSEEGVLGQPLRDLGRR